MNDLLDICTVEVDLATLWVIVALKSDLSADLSHLPQYDLIVSSSDTQGICAD